MSHSTERPAARTSQRLRRGAAKSRESLRAALQPKCFVRAPRQAPKIELHIDALLTFSASRVTSLHSPPPLHPSDRSVAAMGAANRQPIAGHGQHAAWRAVPLDRDASLPISSTLIELRFQHGQSPVDITGCNRVRIGHVAAPSLRRLKIKTCGLLSKVQSVDQRMCLGMRCWL